MTEKFTAAQITALLQHRHAAPEWGNFVQLPSNTGGINRYLDFYAINLWHSKRYLKIAYEIKVSRSDFNHELDNPLKRRFAETVADECYFAMPINMVSPDEIPQGWGLIEMNKGGLRVKKRATQRAIENLPMSFIASLARRLSDPPQQLPAATWLLAGQEIDQARLTSAANEQAAIELALAKRDAVFDFQRSDEFKKLRRLAEIIQLRIGWSCASDPKLFSDWIDQAKENAPATIPDEVAKLLLEINRTAEKAVRVMERYQNGH